MSLIIEKIIHKEETRIKVAFPYNQEIAQKIRQIDDAKWSKTQNAWHIPYKKESYQQLLQLFPNLQKSNKQTIPNPIKTQKTGISLHIFPKKIILKMPKNETDVQFIVNLKYSRWDKNERVWIIPNYKNNLQIIQEYFKNRIDNTITESIQSPEKQQISHYIDINELLIIYTNQRIKLIFRPHKNLIKFIKTLPYWKWDNENKWWSVPYSEKFISELKQLAIAENLLIKEQKEVIDEKKPRIMPHEIPNYRTCRYAKLTQTCTFVVCFLLHRAKSCSKQDFWFSTPQAQRT